jgi:hypothetical protein
MPSGRIGIVITILLLLFVVAGTEAQTQSERWGLWFIPSTIDRIHGIAIGPFHSFLLDQRSRTKGQIINGVAVELIGIGILAPLAPVDPVHPRDSAIRRSVANALRNGGGVNGIALSLSGAEGLAFVNGIVVGGFCGLVLEVNGISVHPLFNFTHHINGIGVGLVNATIHGNGLQGGFLNRADDLDGVQIGVFNRTDNLDGVQIGVFNECYGSFRGVQIGLVNIGPNGWMPILNVGF